MMLLLFFLLFLLNSFLIFWWPLSLFWFFHCFSSLLLFFQHLFILHLFGWLICFIKGSNNICFLFPITFNFVNMCTKWIDSTDFLFCLFSINPTNLSQQKFTHWVCSQIIRHLDCFLMKIIGISNQISLVNGHTILKVNSNGNFSFLLFKFQELWWMIVLHLSHWWKG